MWNLNLLDEGFWLEHAAAAVVKWVEMKYLISTAAATASRRK